MLLSLMRRLDANVTDARKIGLKFVTRHLHPFSSRHSFTLGGKPVSIRTKSTDPQIARCLLTDGEYELEDNPRRRVMARYREILNSGKKPVIIDAGGNIGLTAAWFASQYPEAAIVTIEPDPGNFDLLSTNVRPWSNIVATRSALGGQPGSADLSGDREWGYQTTRSEDGAIPIITIAQAKAMAGADAELLIVKIDIEGFEAEVFDGDCAWIDETECVMLEPHDWLRPTEATSRSFQREMGKRDFSLHVRFNNLIYVRRSH